MGLHKKASFLSMIQKCLKMRFDDCKKCIKKGVFSFILNEIFGFLTLKKSF